MTRKIKHDILIRFGLFGASFVLAFGVIVTLNLNGALSRQTRLLGERLEHLIGQNLDGQHRLFRSKLAEIGNEMLRIADAISINPQLLQGIGKLRVAYLNGVLETYKDRLDFALLLDLEGRHIASYPSDTGNRVDLQRIESLVRTWPLWEKALAAARGGKEEGMTAMDRHDADFISALSLTSRYPDDKALLSVSGAAVVKDDFQDAIAILVAGKILNHHDQPLADFFAVTGISCAVCLDGTPVALAGFSTGPGKGIPVIPDETLQRLYRSPASEHMELRLPQGRYLGVASRLTGSGGQPLGAAVVALEEKSAREIEAEFTSLGTEARKIIQLGITLTAIAGLLLLFPLVYVIARRIEIPLRRISKGLTASSGTVASSAAQIAATSQRMAMGASQQAAAGQESAASLTLMTQTSKDTSELTLGAGALMTENIKKSVKSVQLLIELTANIELIESDGDRIGQIIQTIDEISFQTNLLSLNAAIEAARAGEAGAGFAVVAEEIRALAQKASLAANTTQELLEATIQRVADSSNSIREMNEDFEGIIHSATSIGDKTTAITKASEDLARSLEQISIGVLEMDRVAQETAAHSEEFAASSEELSAEAEQLRCYVQELEKML